MGCFLCFERCSTVLNIIPGAYKCCAEPFHLVTFSGEIHRRPPVFHQIFWLQNRSSPFKDGNLHFFNYESKWDTKQKIPGCLTSRVHEILQKNITCNHFTKPKDIWVQSSFFVVAEIVTCLDVLFFLKAHAVEAAQHQPLGQVVGLGILDHVTKYSARLL